MAYNFSKGSQVIGDLKAADDAQRNTMIDFGEDQIVFQTSGSTRMTISNEGAQVTGLMIGSEYSLPETDGSANQVIKTDGNGNLSFGTVSGGGGGSPGGSDTQVQINNGGSFGGLSGLTYDGSELFVSSSVRVVGDQRINDPSFADSNQRKRSFTYKAHFNFNNVSANTWHDVVSFRPYKTGTTTDPESNTFYATVAFKMNIGGNTGGVGDGSKFRVGHVQYAGSSATNEFSSDTNLADPVSARTNLSGWTTALQINPNQGGANGFTGVVFVEIYFTMGGGSNGNNIEWSIT